MDKEKTMKLLLDFVGAEKTYRDMYNKLREKEVYRYPIESWKEFVEKSDSVSLPIEAPSPICEILYENEWFMEKGMDVAIVKNDRYCPPFWHSLEFIKIVCVLQGYATMYISEEAYEIDRNVIYIVPPNTRNAIFSHDDNDIVINVIVKYSTFENAFSSILSENSEIAEYFWQMLYKKNMNEVLIFRTKKYKDVHNCILELYNELCLEKEHSSIVVKGYLMLLFGYIVKSYECDRVHDEKNMDDRLSGIIRYINEHIDEVTMPGLAAEYGLSEGYMSRYIRRETGEAFASLLRRTRLQKAARMLVSSDYSIEEICFQVGYSDISRFYRNFKSMYGMTPSQFRRR